MKARRIISPKSVFGARLAGEAGTKADIFRYGFGEMNWIPPGLPGGVIKISFRNTPQIKLLWSFAL